MISAQVLGAFRLAIDDRSVERADWQRLSAERLVKLLLVTDAHSVSRERAIETLWPDLDPARGSNHLRKALHFARRALGTADTLQSVNGMLCLDPARLDLDLDRLRAAFDLIGAEVRPGPRRPVGRDTTDEEQRRTGVADAKGTVLELGARPLLPDDAYEDWLVAPREQLQSRWQRIAMAAASEARAAGHTAEAHAILDQILDRDPTDEDAHRMLIELFASEGRHHAARRQFELCRRALAENLDAEPSAETEAVYRRAEAAATVKATPRPQVRLVSRRAELARVEPLVDRLGAGRSGGIVIRGPAGIGKTRLLEEIREVGRGAGWLELSWQAIESTTNQAFAPFVLRLGDLLVRQEVEEWDEPSRSAVGTLLPGLGVRPRLEFADRSAFILALVGSLERVARRTPLFIAIDDLPWLDEASTELLATMTSACLDVPILLLVAYRDEEPVPAATASLLGGLRRGGAVEVAVGPLAERDTEPLLLAHLGGEAVAPELADWLFERSEGNPLFCVEMARDLVRRGAVRLDSHRWHLTAAALLIEPPEAVRVLVAGRVGSLPDAAIGLLQVAAELGPVVPYETLAAVMPDPGGGLIPALDAALASGLLMERSGGYAFAHPLFRDAIVSRRGIARRAGLQLSLARALAGVRAADEVTALPALAATCADPPPAAEHALQACELGLRDAAPLAVALGFAAGLRARQLFDRAAASSFLERATEVWARLPAGIAGLFDATTALVNLAELRMAADDHVAAEATFRAALAAARTADELGYAYEHFWWLPYGRGDSAAAIALSDEAFSRIPPEAVESRALLQVHVGFCLGRHGRVDEGVERMERGARVIEAAGKRAELSKALGGLGWFQFVTGRRAEGLATLERSLALALELGDFGLENMIRIHIAGCLTKLGRPREARVHVLRAIEAAELIGDWYVASVAGWIAAEAQDELGDYQAAAELRRKELGLLARIGGNPHNEARAHAHLAHLARIAGDVVTEADEAGLARRLAALDEDAGYAALIENALTIERWSDVEES